MEKDSIARLSSFYYGRMVTITHRIDERLKERFDRYCEDHGLKAQAVIQEALAQWLEDAEDLELIEDRRQGPWVEWEEVRADGDGHAYGHVRPPRT